MSQWYSVSWSEYGFAQQRRGELVEGLLRGFIEVQLEKERHRTIERQQLVDRQRQHQVTRPQAVGTASVQVREYRTKLDAFAKESALLATSLQQSAGRVRGVRPLLANTLTLKTRAAVMNEQSQRVHDLSLLGEEYCDLDCQWRELSFQLRQLRGLDATTLARVQHLNGHCDDLCQLLELEPQFDRRAVVTLTVATTVHLGTLLEDIQLELYEFNGAASLVRECRGLSEQSRRLVRLASDASYDDLPQCCKKRMRCDNKTPVIPSPKKAVLYVARIHFLRSLPTKQR